MDLPVGPPKTALVAHVLGWASLLARASASPYCPLAEQRTASDCSARTIFSSAACLTVQQAHCTLHTACCQPYSVFESLASVCRHRHIGGGDQAHDLQGRLAEGSGGGSPQGGGHGGVVLLGSLRQDHREGDPRRRRLRECQGLQGGEATEGRSGQPAYRGQCGDPAGCHREPTAQRVEMGAGHSQSSSKGGDAVRV